MAAASANQLLVAGDESCKRNTPEGTEYHGVPGEIVTDAGVAFTGDWILGN
jgi:hypothetical protein